MRKPPAELNIAIDGFTAERLWRLCVLRTLRDLRGSVSRGRTLSLSNLWRLFDQRWSGSPRSQEIGEYRRRMGRDFLRQYYLARQPFRAWRGRRGRMENYPATSAEGSRY